jgi:hypothetical protein
MLFSSCFNRSIKHEEARGERKRKAKGKGPAEEKSDTPEEEEVKKGRRDEEMDIA